MVFVDNLVIGGSGTPLPRFMGRAFGGGALFEVEGFSAAVPEAVACRLLGGGPVARGPQ